METKIQASINWWLKKAEEIYSSAKNLSSDSKEFEQADYSYQFCLKQIDMIDKELYKLHQIKKSCGTTIA